MRLSGNESRRVAACWLAAALLIAISAGCDSQEDSQTAKRPGEAGGSNGSAAAEGAADTADTGDTANEGSHDLAERGERIYNVNCIACHHRDPSEDGGLGPAIAGASFELLEARVLRAAYPPGYTPKRDTRLMVPLPHLTPEIEALTVFLAQAAPK